MSSSHRMATPAEKARERHQDDQDRVQAQRFHDHAGEGQEAARPLRAGLCDVRSLLQKAGLRPTRQRLALGQILFTGGGRHVTAERLHEDAVKGRVPVSLATIYNTLHQFTEAGLLRQVALDGSKTYFDTNTSDHHHFFVEENEAIIDIPHGEVTIDGLPKPPEGMEISRVDVVVRVRRVTR